MKKKINKIINKLIRNTPAFDSYIGGTRKFQKLKTFNLDCVNLGSNSGLNAFDYSNIKSNARNWALGPQSLIHDFNILKNYFSFLRDNAVVFISLCPFSCLITEYKKEHNFKYYTILHPATIIDFDDNERTKAYKLNLDPINHISIVKLLKIQVRSIINAIKNKVKKCNMEKDAERMIKMWKKQFKIDDLSSPIDMKHENEMETRSKNLSEIISFCKERNLKPILVIPPAHPSLTKYFNDTFMKNYVEAFVNKANSNNVPFYNYLKSSEFSSNKYFKSSFFLNKKGAQKFTQMILREAELI